MKTKLVVIALTIALASANAFADCTRGGSTYGEGATVGPYTCQGGQWVRK